MPWHAIIKKADGTLVSEASVVASQLPAELEAVVLPARIDWLVERWDPATRTVVAKPARLPDVDRITDFMERATFLDGRLTAPQRTQFRTLLGTFLGSRRFRDPSEPVDL